jgi:carboxypeptidase PM20D1
MTFIERFCGTLRIPTWWPAGAKAGDAAAEAPLLRFQELLTEYYPAFHQAAERWALSPYSVVYRWPGISADGAVLFLAHYDVVPVEREKWTVDPFGAEMRDGFIYGRGALDMKSILAGLMEAAEQLCAGGFRPARDIWFAFGGDEERTGLRGAMETAKWFAGRGQRFAWVLDEGTPVAENQIKSVNSPLALISIEEKGYLSLDLTAAQKPGHASRPPRVQAAAVLARALCRIAKKPFPFQLVPTAANFFRQAASFSAGGRGFVMRHARALGPLFFRLAAKDAALAALLRTTVAMTQLEGSAAENVMPSEARAVINLRLLGHWTVEKAAGFIKKAINDERVKISVRGLASNPVPANPEHARGSGPGWKEMEAAVRETFPGVPLSVFIMVATTDSRHYQNLADGIFRFSPHRLGSGEMSRVHGHDERISEENLHNCLRFYTVLLRAL